MPEASITYSASSTFSPSALSTKSTKRALCPQRVARHVTPSEPRPDLPPTTRCPDADPLRERFALRERKKHVIDELRASQDCVIWWQPSKDFASARWKIHAERREEPSSAPASKRGAYFFCFDDADRPSAPYASKRSRNTNRSRADYDEAALAHFLRDIVFRLCAQCAIVPPPRMTAATFRASASSSGVIPSSVHADA